MAGIPYFTYLFRCYHLKSNVKCMLVSLVWNQAVFNVHNTCAVVAMMSQYVCCEKVCCFQ